MDETASELDEESQNLVTDSEGLMDLLHAMHHVKKNPFAKSKTSLLHPYYPYTIRYSSSESVSESELESQQVRENCHLDPGMLLDRAEVGHMFA